MVSVVALALALLAQPEPALGAAVDDTPAPAVEPAKPPTDWQSECRTLVDKGALQVAVECYRHAGHSGVDDAALALALADVVAAARLAPLAAPPAEAPMLRGGFDLGDFALGGGAEAVGFAFVDGFIAGAVVVPVVQPLLGNGVFFAPLGLGLLAGGGTLTGLLVLDARLTDGDVHLLRFGAFVGPFEALALGTLASTLPGNGTPTVALGAAAVGALVPLGLAAAGAGVFDVDPAAPSLATSFGALGGVVALTLVQGLDVARAGNPAQVLTGAALIGAHAGMAAGFAAAPALQLSRPSTLIIDAGTAVGVATGAALAFGLRAPNPALGYGAIGAGAVVGAGVGVVGAVFVDGAFAADAVVVDGGVE
jgi:hypothetical protein